MQDETENETTKAAENKVVDFTGRLLIAMPGMEDPRFAHSVVFLCAHSEDGAMGLIVNKAIDGVGLSELLEQLSIEPKKPLGEDRLFFGGPVETGRGFVLHSAEYQSALSSLKVCADFSMTATQDVLDDIAQAQGPAQALTALGYSGWGAGQLEREIGENGWLIAEATPDLVFGVPNELKWAKALKSIGVDALSLSSTAGHA